MYPKRVSMALILGKKLSFIILNCQLVQTQLSISMFYKAKTTDKGTIIYKKLKSI